MSTKAKTTFKFVINSLYVVVITLLLTLFIVVINYLTMTNLFNDIESSLKSKSNVGNVEYSVMYEPYSQNNIKRLKDDSRNKDLIIYEFSNKTILLHNKNYFELSLDKTGELVKTSEISSLFVLSVLKDVISIFLVIILCAFFYRIDKYRRNYMNKDILIYYSDFMTKINLIKFTVLIGIFEFTFIKLLSYFVYIYDTSYLIVGLYCLTTFFYIIFTELKVRSQNMKELLNKEYEKLKLSEEKERKRLERFEKKREKNKGKKAKQMSKTPVESASESESQSESNSKN